MKRAFKKIEDMTREELIEEAKIAWKCANAIDKHCWDLAKEIDKWRGMCWFSIITNIIFLIGFFIRLIK